MQLKRFAILAAALFASFFPSAITTLAEELRAPCVPLIACDPYFSVWSNTDELADSFPVHWTGRIHALTSFVKVDGQNYRVMGKPTEFKTEKATQKSVSVRPTTTEYVFEAGGRTDAEFHSDDASRKFGRLFPPGGLHRLEREIDRRSRSRRRRLFRPNGGTLRE